MTSIIESEFRSYSFIEKRLKEMGWDTRSPARGGRVYTQNEARRQNPKLKEALGLGKPEYVAVVREKSFWVIEAKASEKDICEALKDAKNRAKKINATTGIQCRLITGVAGSPDSTLYIETYCLVDGKWKPLQINNKRSTGFISPEQAYKVVEQGKGKIDDYDIPDMLFRQKAKEINALLHNGAFDKRDRAGALACMLLALANDPRMSTNQKPRTFIRDINNRARDELEKYGKGAFYKRIAIKQSPSSDNHDKNRDALAQSITILRDLNIASTINSGRDILGQCYEEFLIYANDAKEIGIVLTPRHITNFGARVIDIQKNDIVFDPTSGTGGFLVAALDKVRNDGGDINRFKKGNLYGVEQDAFIATLAIVNMVFRGDGSSNIIGGDCLKVNIEKSPDKVLMNPPFALKKEKEWQFVDKALKQTKEDGLLFAVLPVNTMSSSKDGRGEITWRQNLLKRHTLISVVKMPENLFYPFVSKGTYGVTIKAHRPHDIGRDKVIWAVLEDGIARTKTKPQQKDNNMKILETSIRNYLASETEPQYIPAEMDCSTIEIDDSMDLSPEKHIGISRHEGKFDIGEILKSIDTGKQVLDHSNDEHNHTVYDCGVFQATSFFKSMETGKSGRNKIMRSGAMPLISTSEVNNGISAMVNREECKKIYTAGHITISKNGGCGRAHYHDYEFAANSDVFVCELKKAYNDRDFAIFLCAAINSENWRYNYYRKLTQKKMDALTIKVPTRGGGGVDMKKIQRIVARNNSRNSFG